MPKVHQYPGANECRHYADQRGSGHITLHRDTQCADARGWWGFVSWFWRPSKCFQPVQCSRSVAWLFLLLKEGRWKSLWPQPQGSWFAPHWLWCLWGGTAQWESSRRRSETWPSWGQRWMWPLVLRRVNRFQTASHWQWYIWTTSMRLPSWSESRMNWVKKGRWQRITVGSSKFVTQKDYPGIWENNWSGPCQERCKEENLMGTEVPSKLAMTSLKALWKWLWGCWQVHVGRSLAYDIGRARLPSAVLSGECCLPGWVGRISSSVPSEWGDQLHWCVAYRWCFGHRYQV